MIFLHAFNTQCKEFPILADFDMPVFAKCCLDFSWTTLIND